MGIDLMNLPAYEPRWPGVLELNLQDQWRARWVDEQELPENAPVSWAYGMVCMGDNGYATRAKGGARWEMIEGPTGDKQPEAFVKQAAIERMGATAGRMELIGFFECKATRLNTGVKPGTITVRPSTWWARKWLIARRIGYERGADAMAEFLVACGRVPESSTHRKCASRYANLRAKAKPNVSGGPAQSGEAVSEAATTLVFLRPIGREPGSRTKSTTPTPTRRLGRPRGRSALCPCRTGETGRPQT